MMGQAKVGKSLTAMATFEDAVAAEGCTIEYQWRLDEEPSQLAAKPTFQLTASEAGCTISCIATPVKSASSDGGDLLTV